MNNVNIIGRITADTELKITESGTTVCEFNIAIARSQNTADFIKCVAFKKQPTRFRNTAEKEVKSE